MKYRILLLLAISCLALANITAISGSLTGHKMYNSTCDFDVDNLKWGTGYAHKGQVPQYENTRPMGDDGEPIMLMKTFKVVLEGNIKVNGVSLSDNSNTQLDGNFFIEPHAQSEVIGSKLTPAQSLSSVYTNNAFFPGKWIDFDSGFDGENTVVYVRVYPLQYNPVSGEVLMLEHGQFSIYGEEVQVPILSTHEELYTDAENIIITTSSLVGPAEMLMYLHESWGTTSEVMYLINIFVEYDPAEGPYAHPGYSSEYERPDFLSTYGYDPALRIINFLRDEAAHPNLKSVTILGDAADVPPSYYAKPMSFHEEDNYGDFIPTDMFYASPDYDWIIDYAVGRIPLNNIDEINTYYDKIEETGDLMTSEWQNNVCFAGGNPFNSTKYYEGESPIVHIHNEGLCDAFETIRLFHSDDKFSYSHWNEAWTSGDYAVFHVFAHGSGSTWSYDDHGSFGVYNFATTPIEAPYPIVFGLHCKNGIFDQDIISEIDIPVTYSESFIKELGGGAMLIAFSRNAYGGQDFYVSDHVTQLGYMRNAPLMSFEFMQALSESPSNCGELFTNMMNYFVEDADMSSEYNMLTWYETIMHGDPVLPIMPIDTMPEHSEIPAISYTTPLYSTAGNGYATFKNHTALDFEVEGTTPPYYGKLQSGMDETQVYYTETVTGSRGTVPLPEHTTYTFMRLEAEDGKAQWLNFLTSNSLIVPDADSSDWHIESIEPSLDPDDFLEDEYELTNLYGYFYRDELYIGFPFFGVGGGERIYNIAIDVEDGGFGHGNDYFGNHVSFETREPEFIYSIYIGYDYDIGFGPYVSTFLCMHDGSWVELSVEDYGIMYTVNGTVGFFEMSAVVGEDAPDELAIMVYSSTYRDRGVPALDATPYNEGCRTEYTTAPVYTTLDNWMVLEKMGIEENSTQLPEYSEISAYPNPFNPSVKIETPESTPITITDITGKVVKTFSPIGTVTVWTPSEDIDTGVYLINTTDADGKASSKKVVYVK